MQRIAILATSGCWVMHVSMLQDFFHIVALLEQQAGQPAGYQVDILSSDGNTVISASGSAISVDHALQTSDRYDLIIIPGFKGDLIRQLAQQEASQVICHWLALAMQHTPVIALSTAVYFLCATGLVNELLLTTHWAFVRNLQALFPACQLTSGHHYLRAGHIYSTGSLAGSFDALLDVVSQHKGDHFAQLCAAHLLLTEVHTLRPVLYRQHNHQDAAILQVQDWIESNYASHISIAQLAGKFGFSERNLKRRFQQATGIAPNQYQQQVRVDKAKKLLISTSLSIQQIAYDVGYQNTSFFIRIFKNYSGLTPAAWKTGAASPAHSLA